MEINTNYLFDTNIFLEILLEQKNSTLSMKLMNHKNINYIYISDFSLHSIGVILNRKGKDGIFNIFLNELISNKKVKILTVNLDKMVLITENISNFKLDFDDAYQLTLSQIYDLNILTYDNDFKNEGVNSINPLDLDIFRN